MELRRVLALQEMTYAVLAKELRPNLEPHLQFVEDAMAQDTRQLGKDPLLFNKLVATVMVLVQSSETLACKLLDSN